MFSKLKDYLLHFHWFDGPFYLKESECGHKFIIIKHEEDTLVLQDIDDKKIFLPPHGCGIKYLDTKKTYTCYCDEQGVLCIKPIEEIVIPAPVLKEVVIA